jgi:rfaE bifunctional protein nucleotidyltransferase chain/domain
MKNTTTKYELDPENELLKSDKRDRVVVLVSGCYDLLHFGHVSFLNKCKEGGHILVVGVNSDELVRSQKGKDRPILPENDRAFLVSNLKSVDYAFIKREPFIKNAIDLIKPNKIIFCKERDNDFSNYEKIIDIYNQHFPEIECIIMDRKSAGTTHGSSTTKIINRILGKYDGRK